MVKVPQGFEYKTVDQMGLKMVIKKHSFRMFHITTKSYSCSLYKRICQPSRSRIPWRRKWQPTPEFLPGKSCGQEPGGLPFMGSQRLGHNLVTKPPTTCCSVAQSCPILRPNGLLHTRLPCPSPSPGVYSSSCPLSRWCHPAISSSVTPFSCPQSFPASRSFPVSRLSTSGGQSIGASALASVIPTLRTYFFQDGLVWSPYSQRYSFPTSYVWM